MASLVEIEDCECFQYITGVKDIALSQGTLLILEDASDLLLKCGKSAFKISRNAKFYTLAQDSRSYLFEPSVQDGSLPKFYVKIRLPDNALSQQDQLEDVLVRRGHLKEGYAAAGDELGRGLAEGAAGTSQSIQQAAEAHNASPPNPSIAIPQPLNNAAQSTADATKTAQDYTHSISETLGSYAESAGSATSGYVKSAAAKTGLFEGEKSQARKTAEDMGQGVIAAGGGASEAASEIYTASKEAAHDSIKHDAGAQVVDLTDNSGATLENIGSMSADVLMTTSTAFHGAKAAEGAQKEAFS